MTCPCKARSVGCAVCSPRGRARGRVLSGVWEPPRQSLPCAKGGGVEDPGGIVRSRKSYALYPSRTAKQPLRLLRSQLPLHRGALGGIPQARPIQGSLLGPLSRLRRLLSQRESQGKGAVRRMGAVGSADGEGKEGCPLRSRRSALPRPHRSTAESVRQKGQPSAPPDIRQSPAGYGSSSASTDSKNTPAPRPSY